MSCKGILLEVVFLLSAVIHFHDARGSLAFIMLYLACRLFVQIFWSLPMFDEEEQEVFFGLYLHLVALIVMCAGEMSEHRCQCAWSHALFRG